MQLCSHSDKAGIHHAFWINNRNLLIFIQFHLFFSFVFCHLISCCFQLLCCSIRIVDNQIIGRIQFFARQIDFWIISLNQFHRIVNDLTLTVERMLHDFIQILVSLYRLDYFSIVSFILAAFLVILLFYVKERSMHYYHSTISNYEMAVINKG